MAHDKFRTYQVSWPDAIMKSVESRKLPSGWNAQPPSATPKNIGDEWVKARRSAVLALPSVLVPIERTFLLNPEHPVFSKIKIKETGTFTLDQRLKQ